MTPPLSLNHASLAPLWSDLIFSIQAGEFVTVLGPNGIGKSSLLGAILGQRTLTGGSIDVNGRIGYIPQQRMFDPELPLRARDLVSLSLAHGTLRGRRPSSTRINELLETVGAREFADKRVGLLSGGQQQLIRQAQALANDPEILLCDEPLLSLDFRAAAQTVERLKQRSERHGTAILLVTHSLNPLIDATDRVLYIAPHGHLIGTVDEVMRSDVLTSLYRTKVTVATINGRIVVI